MELNLPLTVDNFNKEHANFIKNYFIQKNPDKSVPFVMEYISYKKGTDIIEESQQFQLCVDLLNEGYTLHITEIDSVINKLQEMSELYDNRLKFFKPGTDPQGYKIKL
jgi:membrane-anchored protein YejM (alkaline phosphatase superfamily)